MHFLCASTNCFNIPKLIENFCKLLPDSFGPFYLYASRTTSRPQSPCQLQPLCPGSGVEFNVGGRTLSAFLYTYICPQFAVAAWENLPFLFQPSEGGN